MEVSSCRCSSTGLLSWRIAANLFGSGVGTRGGRAGVASTRSRRPSGVRGEGGAARTNSAEASSSAARWSSSSRSLRSLRASLQAHSLADSTRAKDSSAVSVSSSPRSSSASSRSRSPLRWMTSSSAHSSSSAGREREADADECASFPHDVSVLKPESWNWKVDVISMQFRDLSKFKQENRYHRSSTCLYKVVGRKSR